MTGVLILRLDDLAAVVETAVLTDEVRALRLVALRALDGRHRSQLPIGGAAAARFRARGFPLEIGHGVAWLLRVRAAAGAVLFEATGRAEPSARGFAEEHVGKRRVDELPHEVGQVQFVAGEDVAFVERILAVACGFEAFVDAEVDGQPDVVETAGALARGLDVDASLQLDPPADPADRQRNVGRSGKPEGSEVG